MLLKYSFIGFLLTPSLVCLSFLSAFSQHQFSGVVKDKSTDENIPGVNVVIESTEIQTVTDADGRFLIEYSASSAELSFSFIGLETKVVRVTDQKSITVYMNAESILLEKSKVHRVRTGIDLGYYGDANYAPIGFMVYNSWQGIGKLQLEFDGSFKYWQGGNNTGYDVSISKQISSKTNFIPNNIVFAYKSMDYEKAVYRQSKAYLSNAFESIFTLDLGISFNEYTPNNEESVTDISAAGVNMGFALILGHFTIFKNLGLYSNLNYFTDHTFYEAGVYKGIYLRKLPSMVLMAKYYNYDTIDGFFLSLKINVFSTQRFCCDSWYVYYDDLNALR